MPLMLILVIGTLTGTDFLVRSALSTARLLGGPLRFCQRRFRFVSVARAMARQRGFTLLELLVVILVIGLIMSFASLSVGQTGGRVADEEGRRLAALIQLAEEEAILRGEERVVELESNAYQFSLLGPAGNPVAMDDGTESTFRARELPAGVTLTATLNGEEAKLVAHKAQPKDEAKIDADADDEDKSKTEKKERERLEGPAIMLLSSGEMTPFVLDVRAEDGSIYRVTGDFNGKVTYTGRVESQSR